MMEKFGTPASWADQPKVASSTGGVGGASGERSEGMMPDEGGGDVRLLERELEREHQENLQLKQELESMQRAQVLRHHGRQ